MVPKLFQMTVWSLMIQSSKSIWWFPIVRRSKGNFKWKYGLWYSESLWWYLHLRWSSLIYLACVTRGISEGPAVCIFWFSDSLRIQLSVCKHCHVYLGHILLWTSQALPRMLPVSPPGFPHHPLLCEHQLPGSAQSLFSTSSRRRPAGNTNSARWASSWGWAWPSAGSPSPPCLGSTCFQGSRLVKQRLSVWSPLRNSCF